MKTMGHGDLPHMIIPELMIFGPQILMAFTMHHILNFQSKVSNNPVKPTFCKIPLHLFMNGMHAGEPKLRSLYML